MPILFSEMKNICLKNVYINFIFSYKFIYLPRLEISPSDNFSLLVYSLWHLPKDSSVSCILLLIVVASWIRQGAMLAQIATGIFDSSVMFFFLMQYMCLEREEIMSQFWIIKHDFKCVYLKTFMCVIPIKCSTMVSLTLGTNCF